LLWSISVCPYLIHDVYGPYIEAMATAYQTDGGDQALYTATDIVAIVADVRRNMAGLACIILID